MIFFSIPGLAPNLHKRLQTEYASNEGNFRHLFDDLQEIICNHLKHSRLAAVHYFIFILSKLLFWSLKMCNILPGYFKLKLNIIFELFITNVRLQPN